MTAADGPLVVAGDLTSYRVALASSDLVGLVAPGGRVSCGTWIDAMTLASHLLAVAEYCADRIQAAQATRERVWFEELDKAAGHLHHSLACPDSWALAEHEHTTDPDPLIDGDET